MSDALGPVWRQSEVVELRVAISPAGLLSIAAIILAGAVVTGVAIREAKRPGRPRLKGNVATPEINAEPVTRRDGK